MRNDQRRVSLAEMSQQAMGVLRRATYDEFDAAASPTFDELTNRFSSHLAMGEFGSTINACFCCTPRRSALCVKN